MRQLLNVAFELWAGTFSDEKAYDRWYLSVTNPDGPARPRQQISGGLFAPGGGLGF